MNEAIISRRFFLTAASAAGGGLLIGSTLRPEMLSAVATQRSVADVSPYASLNHWIRISPDDVVTLISSQSEMGQGVMTTLPAVLAEELGADWSRIKIEFSPTAPSYRNPRINWQFTGNSESTTGFFELLRTMGASARELLISAAANRWGVQADECSPNNGRVTHRPAGRSLKFGDIAEDAAGLVPPANPKPKLDSEWNLLGKSLARVDVPGKVNGSAVFGLDFTVPGMVCAAI